MNKEVFEKIEVALRDAFEAAKYYPWFPSNLITAPQDRAFLAVVDGEVRRVQYGKTSHVPIYGFCLADQGAEDFDLCRFDFWMDLPKPPKTDGERA